MTLSPAQLTAGEARLRALLAEDAPLNRIVLEVWQEMRSVKNPVGRPLSSDEAFALAMKDARNGERLTKLRKRYGLSGSLVERIKRELEP